MDNLSLTFLIMGSMAWIGAFALWFYMKHADSKAI